MRFIILTFLLLPTLGFSQIVTSSYDRSTLSVNPASSTTRTLSQLAVFDTFKNSDSDIEEPQPDGSKVEWKEKIQLNKVGIYFTGHGKFTPELYLSKDTALKNLKNDVEGSSPEKNKINMTNNMINLGLRLKRNFSIGLKYFAPSYKYKQDVDVNYEGGQTSSYSVETDEKMTGMGAGFIYQYKPNWYLGAYYIKIKQDVKFSNSYTDTGGQTTSDEGDESRNSKMFGGGISYLEGTRGRGLRFELGLSRMIQEDVKDAKDGEEIYSALEFSHRRITFGFNMKFRKNTYYENVELIEYVSGDRSFSTKFTPSYGGFLSFGSSRGHTVGISGFMYRTAAQRQLFGIERDASTMVKQFTVNYAYLF